MKKIAELNDIPKGGSKLVMVDDAPVALFNLKGKIHVRNECVSVLPGK